VHEVTPGLRELYNRERAVQISDLCQAQAAVLGGYQSAESLSLDDAQRGQHNRSKKRFDIYFAF
jgi:hypothetical protein